MVCFDTNELRINMVALSTIDFDLIEGMHAFSSLDKYQYIVQVWVRRYCSSQELLISGYLV